MARTCREAFVSLADAAYDEDRHGPLPDPKPGAGGGTVTARLEAVIRTEAAGSKSDELRTMATKTLAYANSRQHSKTTTHKQAADVIDATIFVPHR